MLFLEEKIQTPAGPVMRSPSSLTDSSTLINIKLPLVSIDLSTVSDIQEHKHYEEN